MSRAVVPYRAPVSVIGATAPHRWALVGEVRRLEAAGRIVVLRAHPDQPINPIWNRDTARWEVRVRRIDRRRPIAPRWFRPVVIGVALFTAFAALGAWVALTLSGTGLLGLCVLAGCGLGVMVWNGRRKETTVDVIVQVKVRR